MCSSLAYSANVKLRKNEINSTILKRWNTFYNNNYLIVMNWTHWWIGHISELERHSEISFENYLSHLKPVITLQIWNVCVCVFAFGLYFFCSSERIRRFYWWDRRSNWILLGSCCRFLNDWQLFGKEKRASEAMNMQYQNTHTEYFNHLVTLKRPPVTN